MSMMRRVGILAAVTILATQVAPASATAQDTLEIRTASPDEIQELRLVDGSTLIGRVVDAGDPVRFELRSGGVVEVPRDRIRSLRTVEGTLRNGEIWEPDPSDNRLFFGPTGRPVGAGRGYLAVFEAIFPTATVGLHDRFSVGAGTLLLGDLGDEERPFWFVPNLNVWSRDGIDLSVGALAITGLGEEEWVGILYGVGTFGTPDVAATAGLGYGWVEDDLADRPAVLLGGEARVAKHVKLITENYFIPTGSHEHEVILSVGPRFMWGNLTADLGIAIPATADDEPDFFPLVNFVYNF